MAHSDIAGLPDGMGVAGSVAGFGKGGLEIFTVAVTSVAEAVSLKPVAAIFSLAGRRCLGGRGTYAQN